jgi:hypothetical protein
MRRKNRVSSKIRTTTRFHTISTHSNRMKLLRVRWLLKNLKLMRNSRRRTMVCGCSQEVKACLERSRWQAHLEIRETYHLLSKIWYKFSEASLNLIIRGIWLQITQNSHFRLFRYSQITITTSIIRPIPHQVTRVFLNETHSKTLLLRSCRIWFVIMNSLTWSQWGNVHWIIVRTKRGGTSRNFTRHARCPLVPTQRRKNNLRGGSVSSKTISRERRSNTSKSGIRLWKW